MQGGWGRTLNVGEARAAAKQSRLGGKQTGSHVLVKHPSDAWAWAVPGP